MVVDNTDTQTKLDPKKNGCKVGGFSYGEGGAVYGAEMAESVFIACAAVFLRCEEESLLHEVFNREIFFLTKGQASAYGENGGIVGVDLEVDSFHISDIEAKGEGGVDAALAEEPSQFSK